MVLGIVGSRSIKYHECSDVIIDYLNKYKPDLVCSGGARGVDTHAEYLAKVMGYNRIIYKADWSLGKSAGFLRNTDIALKSDVLLCIYPGSSPSGGTFDTDQKAFKLGKLVHQVFLNNNQLELF